MQTAVTIDDREKENTDFLLRMLQDRIAQVAVQTIFERFGYKVSPYGYENYLSTSTESMKGSNGNGVVKKIRNSPDFFAYDGDSNQGYLLEVKSTFDEDETRHQPS